MNKTSIQTVTAQGGDVTKVGFKLPLFLLLLSLYSGNYSINRLINFPIILEVKLLLLLPLVLSLIVAVKLTGRPPRKTSSPSAFLLFSIFILFFVASAWWVFANPYTLASVLDILWVYLFTWIAFCLSVRVNDEEIIFTARVIVWVGLLFAVAGFLSAPTNQGRMSAFGGGPNVYVRIVIMALIFAVYLYFKQRKKFYLVLVFPLLIAAVLSGSRGGLVALVGVICFLFILFMKRPTYFYRLFFSALALLGVFWAYLKINPEIQAWFQNRFVSTLFGDRVYTSGRDSLYALGVEMFEASPIWGTGVSGFARVSEGWYPHNLFIEVLVSTGLAGFCFLLMFLLFTTVNFMQYWERNLDSLVFFVGFIFILLASQFSGSFFDTRFAWVFIFLALGLLESSRGRAYKLAKIPSF